MKVDLMRILKWLALVVGILALGYIRKNEMVRKQVMALVSSHKDSTFHASNPPSLSPPFEQEEKTLDEKLESIATVASKALASKAEKDQLRSMLSDPDLQFQVMSVLSADDGLLFDLDHEKRRMQATAFLNLIFKDNGVHGRDRMIRLAADRVLTVNFKIMVDMKQKKSILGDVVEILRALKQSDPDTFQSLANAVAESDKPLQHALKAAG